MEKNNKENERLDKIAESYGKVGRKTLNIIEEYKKKNLNNNNKPQETKDER